MSDKSNRFSEAIFDISNSNKKRKNDHNDGNDKKKHRNEVVNTNISDSYNEDNDEELYEIEYIIDAKIFNNGECKYLVKWKNYSHIHNSWEPSENFVKKDILDEFWDERRRIAFDICLKNEFQTNDFFENARKNE